MSLRFVPDSIELFAHAGSGDVTEIITPHQRGRVKFMATYWFARFYHSDCPIKALPGEAVQVVGREGLTLLVVPASDRVIATPLPMAPQSDLSDRLSHCLIDRN